MSKLFFKVAAGDCLKRLKGIETGSIDLVFVDPPFNINYHYDAYDDRKKPEHYLEWCETWLTELYRVCKKHGTFWLAIGDEFVSELDVLSKRLGFYKRSHVLWYYTFGVACQKNFSRSHTHLLYYTKTKSKFTFNHESADLRVPSARQLVYNDKRGNPDGKLPDNTWILSPLDLTSAFSPDEDTWIASRVCGTFGERVDRGEYGGDRGCPQMPSAVMDRIVLACSRPGDTVLDPMSGTFATGASALRHGRSFIGFDVSELYCRRGRERLQGVLHERNSRGKRAAAGAGTPQRPPKGRRSRPT